MKKQNIFWKWWFTLIVIPTYLFLFNWILDHFAHNEHSVIITWFLILVTAVIAQAIILLVHHQLKSDGKMHMLYILIVFNFTMFTDVIINDIFGFKDFLESKMWIIIAWIISSIIVTAVLFIVKIGVWLWLAHYFLQMRNVKNSKTAFESEVKRLQNEIERLKEQEASGALQTELAENSGLLFGKNVFGSLRRKGADGRTVEIAQLTSEEKTVTRELDFNDDIEAKYGSANDKDIKSDK